MVLDGQLAVGLLDLGGRGGWLDAEDAIVVRVGWAGWHKPSDDSERRRSAVLQLSGGREES
eukprot:scaffold94414_cov69-Phaeocystis_antarctica.AAC.9